MQVYKKMFHMGHAHIIILTLTYFYNIMVLNVIF